MSAGNFTLACSGLVHVAPKSSLVRSTDPQCMLVVEAHRRLRPARPSKAIA